MAVEDASYTSNKCLTMDCQKMCDKGNKEGLSHHLVQLLQMGMPLSLYVFGVIIS